MSDRDLVRRRTTQVILSIRLLIYLGFIFLALSAGARWHWATYVGVGLMVLASVYYIVRGKLPPPRYRR